MSANRWPSRLGLAGGIDKLGARAAELLAIGFGSVEFGTVTPNPEPGSHEGVRALAARLAALPPRKRGTTRIGIGLGMQAAAPEALAAQWTRGLRESWAAADYVSFNLSARRYRPLLAYEHWAFLLGAFAAVAGERERERERSAAGGHRHVGLALKLPLGETGEFPLLLAEAAVDAGFDAVIAVLPEGAARIERLHALAAHLDGRSALIAVGGIRTGADVRTALDAGADGVQVHTIFAELGAHCLPMLACAAPGS